jgi:hypothetical protein
MSLTEATALTGAVFGIAGFVLAIANYLRDRYKIIVRLRWDLSITDNPVYDPSKRWGLILVTNIGRRPVYVSHVALRLPRGFTDSHLVLSEGIRGRRLGEGDPPLEYVIEQESLRKYARAWREIVAQVSDSTGREWVSRKAAKDDAPSWSRPTTTG